MSTQAKINWGALAAWTGVMLTIVGLAGKGVWFLGEIASDVKATGNEIKAASSDIKAIRVDMGKLNERVDNIDRWRSKIDERLKVTESKD